MDSGEHPEALLHKAPDAVPQALLLLPENGIRSHPFQVFQALGQGSVARHIQGSRLQPFRQFIWHFL